LIGRKGLWVDNHDAVDISSIDGGGQKTQRVDNG
jgi:hypothetical protein